MKLLCVLLLAIMLIAPVAFGGEDCGMMGGKCRDACLADEESVAGSFLDCTEKQECCVPKAAPKERQAVYQLLPEDPSAPGLAERELARFTPAP